MRGRELYLELGKESFHNALQHHHDARALKRRGSRGHACALAILSLEEAAKAYLYKLAGEGVYRIVGRKPNNISTFSESQLFDHKFKHGIITRLLIESIQAMPIHRVLSKTRKKSFTRAQVQRLLADLLHEQALQQIELQRDGRGSSSLKKVFGLLERLNETKNDSLYVGHKAGKVIRPDDMKPRQVAEVVDFSSLILDVVGQLIETPFDPKQREQAAAAVRGIAQAVRSTGVKNKALSAEPRPDHKLRPKAGGS